MAEDDDKENVTPVGWARRDKMPKNGGVETVNSVRVREVLTKGSSHPTPVTRNVAIILKWARTDLQKGLPTRY